MTVERVALWRCLGYVAAMAVGINITAVVSTFMVAIIVIIIVTVVVVDADVVVIWDVVAI